MFVLFSSIKISSTRRRGLHCPSMSLMILNLIFTFIEQIDFSGHRRWHLMNWLNEGWAVLNVSITIALPDQRANWMWMELRTAYCGSTSLRLLKTGESCKWTIGECICKVNCWKLDSMNFFGFCVIDIDFNYTYYRLITCTCHVLFQ